MFGSGDPAPQKKKKGGIWPFGERSTKGVDATSYIEYQRSRSTEGTETLYTLTARNTNLSKTIEGTMRTTMETGPGDMKMDTQSFTLGPAEQKKLLVYPTRFAPTYEVTATFRD